MRPVFPLLSGLLAAAVAQASGDAARAPITPAPAGWRPSGPAKVFTGSALYGHIDGGAEIFFEFGFEEATVERFSGGREVVDVELYRMTDPTAALGIYLQRCGNRCEAPGAHEGLPRYATLGRAQAMFVRDRVLGVITTDTAGGAGGAALPAFVSAAASRLPADRPLEPAAALPPGWAAGSLRLIRGPLALQAIITLGEGDVLQLRGKVTAAAADYSGVPGRPAHTLVAADYPDEGAARAAFAHLRAGLDSEITVVREGDGSFVFRDYAGRFGAAGADGRRLTLRLNLEVEPAPGADLPGHAARRGTLSRR